MGSTHSSLGSILAVLQARAPKDERLNTTFTSKALGHVWSQVHRGFGGMKEYNLEHMAQKVTDHIERRFNEVSHEENKEAHEVLSYLIKSIGKTNPKLFNRMIQVIEKLETRMGLRAPEAKASEEAVVGLETLKISPRSLSSTQDPGYPSGASTPASACGSFASAASSPDVFFKGFAAESPEPSVSIAQQPLTLPSTKKIFPAISAALGERLSAAQLDFCSNFLWVLLDEKITHIEDFKGKIIRLHKNQPVSFEDGLEMSPPFSGWLQFKEDGSGVRLHVIDSELLGSGTYKKVKKCHKIYIPFNEGTQALVESKPSVLARVRQSTSIDSVVAGLALHREIISLIAKGTRLVPPADVLDTFHKPESVTNEGVAKTLDERKVLEIVQDWFNGDLSAANEIGEIPSSFKGGSPQHVLSFVDRLEIVENVFDSLQEMHKAGIIHRDVKPANVLLKIEEDGNVHGYLSDFDLTTREGMDIRSPYRYWDVRSKLGYVSPSSDVYGAVVSAADTFIPGFENYISGDFPLFSEAIRLNPEAEWKKLEPFVLEMTLENLRFNPDQISRIVNQFKATGFGAEFDNCLIRENASRVRSPEELNAFASIAIDMECRKKIFLLAGEVLQKDEEVAEGISKDLLLTKLMEKQSLTRGERSVIKLKLAAINARVRIPNLSEVKARFDSIRADYLRELAEVRS